MGEETGLIRCYFSSSFSIYFYFFVCVTFLFCDSAFHFIGIFLFILYSFSCVGVPSPVPHFFFLYSNFIPYHFQSPSHPPFLKTPQRPYINSPLPLSSPIPSLISSLSPFVAASLTLSYHFLPFSLSPLLPPLPVLPCLFLSPLRLLLPLSSPFMPLSFSLSFSLHSSLPPPKFALFPIFGLPSLCFLPFLVLSYLYTSSFLPYIFSLSILSFISFPFSCMFFSLSFLPFILPPRFLLHLSMPSSLLLHHYFQIHSLLFPSSPYLVFSHFHLFPSFSHHCNLPFPPLSFHFTTPVPSLPSFPFSSPHTLLSPFPLSFPLPLNILSSPFLLPSHLSPSPFLPLLPHARTDMGLFLPVCLVV